MHICSPAFYYLWGGIIYPMATKISGTVIGGKKLGRKLGFPTANIVLDESIPVTDGVYAATATVDGVKYEGMANVGGRNNIPGAPRNPNMKQGVPMLEINIFDFDGDLYGKTVEVELLEYVRGERNFTSVEELKQTVDDDRLTIKEYFKTRR